MRALDARVVRVSDENLLFSSEFILGLTTAHRGFITRRTPTIGNTSAFGPRGNASVVHGCKLTYPRGSSEFSSFNIRSLLSVLSNS